MLAHRGEVDADLPAQDYRKYRLDDVNAGATGNAGGDA
jgi:pyruvate dehydrogenase E1 component